MKQSKKPTFLHYLYENLPNNYELKAAITGIISWLREFFSTARWKYTLFGLLSGIIIVYLIIPETSSASFWTLSGVLLSFIFGSGGLYLKNLWKRFRKQSSLGKLLGPIYDIGGTCTIFVSEYWRDISKGNLFRYDKSDELVGTSRVMGTGDSTALPYIYGLLMKAGKSYKELSIVKSYIDFKGEWSNNFISIGGLTNKVTARLMGSYRDRLPYYFSEDGNWIIKDYGHYKRYLEVDNNHDYGIIIKLTGLNHTNRVLFIIAGILDLGTSGAAYYLFDHASELADRYRNDDFALVIGVKKEIGDKSAFEVNFEEKSRVFIINGE